MSGSEDEMVASSVASGASNSADEDYDLLDESTKRLLDESRSLVEQSRRSPAAKKKKGEKKRRRKRSVLSKRSSKQIKERSQVRLGVSSPMPISVSTAPTSQRKRREKARAVEKKEESKNL